MGDTGAHATKKRKTSDPPEGYVCNLCNVSGHWIQQCPDKKTLGEKKRKKKKGTDHVPVPGQDPSADDIESAREMQRIPPPNCFCGQKSRLKKVKKEGSRANGVYFFFCAKQKTDETKCGFGRPVREDEMKPKKSQICAFFAKKGVCKKGDKCLFSHDVSASGSAPKEG